MAPALVDFTIWEAAQHTIKNNRIFGGKLKRVNSSHKEQATLLHGGFVFCARCGGMMTRHWRSDTTQLKPTYRCTKYASTPNHPCKIHGINAQAVDRIALERLAKALTDPEQLLALADAAEEQAARAVADVERAGTALAVYREMDAARETARKGYVDAIAALSAIPGGANRDTITDLRAKLAQLDNEQAKADEDRNHVTPEYERALRRQKMLERLSRFSDEDYIVDFDRMEMRIENEGSGKRVLFKSLDVRVAAELLGMSEADLKAIGIPVNVERLVENPVNDPEGEWVEDVKTEYVILLTLARETKHDSLPVENTPG